MDNDIRSNAGAGAGGTREKVRGKAAEVAGMAKEKIADQYDQQKDRAMNEVEHLATALRRAGENLRDEGNSSIGAAVLSRVAGHLETVGGSMEGKDLDGLVRDVERIARRNPAAFIGGAMLLGFAASRFLKSSGRSMGDNYDYDTRDLTEFGSDYRPTGFSGAGYGTASGFDSVNTGSGRTSGVGSTGLGASGTGDLGSTGIGSTGTGIGSTGTTGTGSSGTTGTTRPAGTRRPGGGNSGSGTGSSGSTGGL